MVRIVILPGLDGSDLLLGRFVELAPAGYAVTVLPLPDDPADDYESLTNGLAARLQEFAPCHLVAESFSGPIGIKLAQEHPELVDQLTLVASFAKSPAPAILRWLPWRLLFLFPLPLFLARYFFVGGDRTMAIKVRQAVRGTSRATLTERIRSVLSVDVCSELASLRCPVRYLRPSRDRLVSRRAVQRILAVNDKEVEHVIAGPHLLLQTRPMEVWTAITGANVAREFV